MDSQFELRVEGTAEVDRAYWHDHGGLGMHWHTAEQHKRHVPLVHETCWELPPPEDLSGTEH